VAQLFAQIGSINSPNKFYSVDIFLSGIIFL